LTTACSVNRIHLQLLESEDHRLRCPHAVFDPASPAKWFASYAEVNLPYLETAQRYHISEYVIATEMVDMTPYPNTALNSLWNAFLARSAKIYRGQISVVVHQAFYFYPHF
jgi:hypothetical protein